MTEASSQTNNARSPPLSRSLSPALCISPSAGCPRTPRHCDRAAATLRPRPRARQRSPPPHARRSAPRASATPGLDPVFPQRHLYCPLTTATVHLVLPSPSLRGGAPHTYPRRCHPQPPGRDEEARGPDGGGCWGCGGSRAGAGASPLPAPPRSSADAPAPVAEPAPWRAAAGRLQPQPLSGPLRGPRAASRGIGDRGTAEWGREEVSRPSEDGRQHLPLQALQRFQIRRNAVPLWGDYRLWERG